MIDKLQRISQTIQFLRLPAIAVGMFCLATTVVIILNTNSTDGDRFLIPSFVGLLWAMSTYTFIVTFRSVPEKAGNSLSLFRKLKRHLHRGWYWVISMVFLGTTITAIYFTNSMISIWLRDYAE
jgi:ABC-type dipeptide/oligopeptide/nickel transport system permease component